MDWNRQRGSTFLVVVIVMLVLGVIGMAMIMFMEDEQSTAYAEMYERDALYAAEMGLRDGERVLENAGSGLADNLLAHVAAASTTVVSPAVPDFPQRTSEYDLAHLGTYLTAGGVELANRQIGTAASPSGRIMPEVFYSLYLRNNPTDISVSDNNMGTDARQDNDFTLNLVSVGWVRFGTRIEAVKILEEEFSWQGVDQAPSAQKLSDAAGTSSAVLGGP
jgi:hypothetical protein